MSSNERVVLQRYLEPVRRQWRIIAIGTAVGAVVGVFLALVLPKQYVSSATLALSPTPADVGGVVSGRTSGQINLDTEAQLVRSAEVMDSVAEALGQQEQGTGLAKNVTVTVPPNTSIMTIAYRASDPETAQNGANATAESYLKNRRAVAEATGKFRADGLKASVAQLDKQIAAAKSTGARDRLEESRAQLIGQVAVIEAERVSPGRIVTKANAPGSADSPNTAVVVISFTALGFIGGLLVAIVLDRRRRRTQGEDPSDDRGDRAEGRQATDDPSAARDDAGPHLEGSGAGRVR